MYYSQYKQDYFLDKVIFSRKKNGFFIDIGAYDGISISNSYFFEKNRNWNGFCFEPNPTVFSKLIKNRKCQCFNVCIGDSKGMVIFTQVIGNSEMLSGISRTYDPRHVERIVKETKSNDGQIFQISVVSKTLKSFFKAKNHEIDFLSIDTEGNEFEILKSIDFNQLSIKVILVENNYNNREIFAYLSKFKYLRLTRLSCDEVYIRSDFYSIEIRFRLILFKIDRRIYLHSLGLRKILRKWI